MSTTVKSKTTARDQTLKQLEELNLPAAYLDLLQEKAEEQESDGDFSPPDGTERVLMSLNGVDNEKFKADVAMAVRIRKARERAGSDEELRVARKQLEQAEQRRSKEGGALEAEIKTRQEKLEAISADASRLANVVHEREEGRRLLRELSTRLPLFKQQLDDAKSRARHAHQKRWAEVYEKKNRLECIFNAGTEDAILSVAKRFFGRAEDAPFVTRYAAGHEGRSIHHQIDRAAFAEFRSSKQDEIEQVRREWERAEEGRRAEVAAAEHEFTNYLLDYFGLTD